MKKNLLYFILASSFILNAVFLYSYRKSLAQKIRASTLFENKSTNNLKLKNLTYHNGLSFSILGKYHDEQNYKRLPAKFQDIVRKDVWNLSNHSSGISIAFKTNSSVIGIKWNVKDNWTKPYMTKIIANGVDLYCFKNDRWQYINSGLPNGMENESLIISDMDTTYKDFMLNLPLFDMTESVEIGIQEGAIIQRSDVIGGIDDRPIVFYGTSITQGGGASRPGMNYPSIISRNLNTEIINLGFSNNGRFENTVGMALCEIDSKLIVLDCVPNSHPDTIKNNVPKLLRQLRDCKPDTPILLIESFVMEYAHFKMSDSTVLGSLKYIAQQNNELRKAYGNAKKEGIKYVYYLEAGDLIGTDHEGTVDGIHPNDLGLLRIANKVQDKIVEVLGENEFPLLGTE